MLRPCRCVRRILAILLVALLLPWSVGAVDSSGVVTVQALAVGQRSDGTLVGTVAQVEAEALAGGSGRVFVDTRPLSQTDMQGSARLAARVAAETLGLDWREYDFLVAFRSGSTVIGGPSAGAVMGLALTAALWNLHHPDDPWRIDRGVAATGTINPDGTIGPVGGVPEKAAGAARAGLHTVLFPAGQEASAQRLGAPDMASFCHDRGIQCSAAVHLVDLIEAAAGRRVERPTVPVPDTSDLPQLRASVDEQVDALEARLATLDWTGDHPGVSAALDAAAGELGNARDQQASQRHYLAATHAFRGAIQVRTAEGIIQLHEEGLARTVVETWLQRCEDGIAATSIPAATDWTALQAIAAAQVRVEQAQDLAQAARLLLEQARTTADWEASIARSAFCIERAETVHWWAGLPALFPPGTPLQAPERTALELIERANDMVTYAEAVQGTAGAAGNHLTDARQHLDAGRVEAAILDAVEAESAASLALQIGTGQAVPDAVLQEALAGASRAIDRARAAGDEPVLSISLIELASISEDSDALADLWTARGMALASGAGDGVSPTVSLVRDPMVVAILLGFSGFLAGVLVVAVAAIVLRR